MILEIVGVLDEFEFGSVPEVETLEFVKAALGRFWPEWSAIEEAYLLPTDLASIQWFHHHFIKSRDPLVELTVVNRSNETIVLYEVGFDVKNIFSDGLGGAGTNASIIEVLADVTIPTTYGTGIRSVHLADPIQIPSQAATRIRIRMKDFAEVYGKVFAVAASFVVNTSAGWCESRTVGF